MAATDVIFPVIDPVGSAGRPLDQTHIALVADVVACHAAEVDAFGVRREVLDELAGAGLLGTALPAEQQRELAELLAGSDASTWFCWVQHQTPLRTLEGDVAGLVEGASDALREELLPGLRAGRLLGAVAFAHVRRPGPANPVATRVSGGWRLDGELDWVTSWDIADVVLIMARGSGVDAGKLVCCYLAAGRSPEPSPGLQVGPPLELLAMAGTHTRPVRLAGVVVPDERVGAVLDRDTWLAVDELRTSEANPSAFGLARGAIADLRVIADRRGDPLMDDLAWALTDECRDLRARAYRSGDVPVADRLAIRAASLDLAARAAIAVVTARAGAAMRSGVAAERRVREAMFLQVQAQTAATRAASLRLLRARTGGSPDVH